MSGTYHYRKSGMTLGPYALEKMRGLARQGQVGRSTQISHDGGQSWDSGASFPEIFAGGEDGKTVSAEPTGPQTEPMTNGGAAVGDPEWHYLTAAAGQQGPVPETQIRQLIRFGRIGAEDTVWTQSLGDSWVPAGSVPRFSALFPSSKDEAARGQSHVRRRERDGRTSDDHRPRDAGTDKNAAINVPGLTGFICSLVAIVLLAMPCLVWVVFAESFFWIFNTVIPCTILAIVGLVLSVVGLARLPRGMATTGTVLGVIAVMLGVMSIVGWLSLPWRIALSRRVTIDSYAATKTLERSRLNEELASYRRLVREESESDATFAERAAPARRRVGEQLDLLVKAYDNHITATTKTWDFPSAFQDLATLSKTVDEVKKAAQAVEGLQPIDVLQAANADIPTLKMLMDLLHLCNRNEITLRQAEAKMTGR
jgi:hypothetical protein